MELNSFRVLLKDVPADDDFYTRDYFEHCGMIFVASGDYYVELPDGEHRVEEGGLVLFHAHQKLHLYSKASPVRGLAVYNSPMLAAGTNRGVPAAPVTFRDDSIRVVATDLFTRMRSASHQSNRTIEYGAHYLCLLVHDKLRTVETHEPASAIRWVDYALRAIEYTLEEDVRLGDYFRTIPISQTHLERLFRSHVGETMVAYRARRRLERAAELLSVTRLSVTEVASYLNYSSSQYFSTSFRRKYGLAPRDFRHRPAG